MFFQVMSCWFGQNLTVKPESIQVLLTFCNRSSFEEQILRRVCFRRDRHTKGRERDRRSRRQRKTSEEQETGGQRRAGFTSPRCVVYRPDIPPIYTLAREGASRNGGSSEEMRHTHTLTDDVLVREVGGGTNGTVMMLEKSNDTVMMLEKFLLRVSSHIHTQRVSS